METNGVRNLFQTCKVCIFAITVSVTPMAVAKLPIKCGCLILGIMTKELGGGGGGWVDFFFLTGYCRFYPLLLLGVWKNSVGAWVAFS